MRLFRNRAAAGSELAHDLSYFASDDPIVLGIPNGGVPVASVVAQALKAPLDILLISRLHSPKGGRHIVGAVDEHGRISLIQSTARWHHLTVQQMIAPAREAYRVLLERQSRFRAILPALDVRDRTVIIVDDGVVSGATMLGAIASVRDRGARRVIATAPAGCGSATWQLHELADQVVIPHHPASFRGIDKFYEDFPPVTNDIVATILEYCMTLRPNQTPGVRTVTMSIPGTNGVRLHCELDLPPGMTRDSGPYPAVLFAHGLESDAHSPRSVPVSRRLAKRQIIGVRFDFTGHGRSSGTDDDATDEQMLDDLRAVHQHVTRLNEVDASRVGINGSGTGAMVALEHAATCTGLGALVIRGPICGNEIIVARRITTPTLLIHAENDTMLTESIETIDRNLAVQHRLLRIPESSRLFSDPISRELMTSASVDWLVDHLANGAAPAASGELQTAASEDGA